MCVCVCSERVCLNPFLPDEYFDKKTTVSKSTPPAKPSVDASDDKKEQPARSKSKPPSKPPSVDVNSDSKERPPHSKSKPGIESNTDDKELIGVPTGRRRGHRLFGTKKFTMSSSLKKLKHKAAQASSPVDGPRRPQRDPWKKRRSLLAPDTAAGGTWSPRRVTSSSSLTSLSDTDGGKSTTSSLSRNILRVL